MMRAKHNRNGNRTKRTKTPRHGVCARDGQTLDREPQTRHTATAAHWVRIARACLFDIRGKGVRG